MSDWKPGDVAERSYMGEKCISLRVSDCFLDGHQRGEHWHHADGTWDKRDGLSAYRPLVVIDPEDREQVERLAKVLTYAGWTPTAETVQAALHEFANPKQTKPDEPTGLGAVVEDVRGVEWMRVGHPHDGRPRPWTERGNVGSVRAWIRYADIDVVRVLSEGVPS